MLAVARALMTNPQLLLMDEPTEGLAPIVVRQIFDKLKELRNEGMTMLLVEQNFHFATRLAVSDACVAARVPLLSAAVGRFQGQVGAFAGHLPEHACYRCFVGDAFDAEDCDTCAEDGVLGAMVGWVGSFAAMQAIRVLLCGVSALGDPQWGTLHLMEGLSPAMRSFQIAKDPACKGCGSAA